jgi:glycogen debranching enzyme
MRWSDLPRCIRCLTHKLSFWRRSTAAYGMISVRLPKIAVGGLLLASALGISRTAPAQETAVSSPGAFPARISSQAIPSHPFSVVGPRGAVLGQQDGSCEVWLFPWKILDGMHITVDMQDYPVPIDVNRQAADIDVEPDHTTITYSHANFTIRQIMLAPKAPADAPGALVFYEFEAVRPMTVTFSFNPVMQRMWPANSPDRPSPEWMRNPDGSGFYILHLNFPEPVAALALPGAEPGILPPYQERASAWPLQFVLHFDPKRDSGRVYPMLFTFADTADAAKPEALRQNLHQLEANASTIRTQNRDYYRDFLASSTSIDTPDPRLDAAFSWAETSIDQLKVETLSGAKEQALTAGFVGSGDAARPGFGWFFGRDALWTLYAVDSYGDFATVKDEIRFLIEHQRADGKIMHEWSQTAGLVDWAALPYQWASSDATPLLLMASADYLRISGDHAFIASIWPSLQRAWTFETTHDSDGDGIYDNSQGSGWVESWIPQMPHQEIYLAALDEQASLAYAVLAQSAGHADLADPAHQRAQRIAKTIETEYALPDNQGYAFSWNGAGGEDTTTTIFPSVAWWDGTTQLAHPDPMMQQWAGSHISTDWGVRILSDQTSFYDPISYHQGTVWPLFTGWVSVAEYRAGHPLAGYTHLMQNVNLTWAQDPGDVTELLSGQFYQVLGRSTAHQLWSSAMVISPILRGLFGIEWNAPDDTLTITPHLPAAWSEATIRRLPFGNRVLDLTFQRTGKELLVKASDADVHLTSHAPGAFVKNSELYIPLAPVEIGVDAHLPEFGAGTHQLKILEEASEAHSLTLHLSAPGDTEQILIVRENTALPKLAAADAKLGDLHDGLRSLHVQFPAGTGYIEKTVTLTW